MTGPDPAVAAVRLAVRGALGAAGVVLVACSGGADSLALLVAAVFETRRTAHRVIGVVVDHGLQKGSAEHTERVVAQMAALGVDETASIRVRVDPGPAGVEAGAREARYAALSQLAAHFGSTTVLLGHTRDDQAETVLLGLARGSGPRSLQGMRPDFEREGVRFHRPLLGLTRVQTEQACRAQDVTWWEDPQNADPRFLRARVRHTVLPLLERELGPGVAAALARTAAQARADLEVVDERVGAAGDRWLVAGAVDLAAMDESVPFAVRSRVVRRAALDAGAVPDELGYEHVVGLFALRPGQQAHLPGHVTAYRDGPLLRFRPTRR